MLGFIKKIIPRRLFSFLQPPYHFLLAWLAAFVYGFPSNRLIVIGVTGTAGKTSTAYLVAKMLTSAGYKSGLSSTAVLSDGHKEWLNNKKMTMPGRFFIQKFLKEMADNGCSYAVVETTSEGIRQFRHRFINYDVLIFTGLYPEHIESHGSFAKYKATKELLFSHLHRCRVKYVDEQKLVVKPQSELRKLDLHRVKKTIIVNGDDEYAFDFLDFWSEVKSVYSFNPEINLENFYQKLDKTVLLQNFNFLSGQIIKADISGTLVNLGGQDMQLKLLGSFNAYNAAAAYAVGVSQDLKIEEIKSALEQITSLAGKMEMIKVGQDFTVLVDYSFEPRALEKLYETISLIPYNRLIHVLGSTGGGRDVSRRPVLGRLAAEKADIVIITNEDPYDEDPVQIINQVSAGAEMVGKTINNDLFKILDRQEAIKKAVVLAKSNNLVLVTGKGAEQYICMAGGRKLPWDDREIVRQALVDKLCVDKQQ